MLINKNIIVDEKVADDIFRESIIEYLILQ